MLKICFPLFSSLISFSGIVEEEVSVSFLALAKELIQCGIPNTFDPSLFPKLLLINWDPSNSST